MSDQRPKFGRIASIRSVSQHPTPGSTAEHLTTITIVFAGSFTAWNCYGRPGLYLGQKVRITDWDKMKWEPVDDLG